MKILSVNVGAPREVIHDGKRVMTGIFKSPVSGPVRVGKINLAGDGQGDLRVHGGVDKAVYAYPFEHYAYWQRTLHRDALSPGHFGENLTIEGLDEAHCAVGDRLRIGDALFAVTQPRVPCFKLGIRFNDMEMVKLFSRSARTGFYLKVVSEGAVAAGDSINVTRNEQGVSVKDLYQAFFSARTPESNAVLARALDSPDLSAEWRKQVAGRLNSAK
ncbi:MAG TPA: MOSC domain-containing protein [Steroidobacteraceae bacterium]|nr:MOSC domain-containing protein [Steroidobacteraceae bacterium]